MRSKFVMASLPFFIILMMLLSPVTPSPAISHSGKVSLQPFAVSENTKAQNTSVYNFTQLNLSFPHMNFNITNNTTLPPGEFRVTFIESGLPSGILWSVTVNGSQENSTSRNISFSLKNGIYPFQLGYINGYIEFNSYNNFTINGTNISININYCAGSVNPGGPEIGASGPSLLPMFYVYLLIAVAVILILIYLTRKIIDRNQV